MKEKILRMKKYEMMQMNVSTIPYSIKLIQEASKLLRSQIQGPISRRKIGNLYK